MLSVRNIFCIVLVFLKFVKPCLWLWYSQFCQTFLYVWEEWSSPVFVVFKLCFSISLLIFFIFLINQLFGKSDVLITPIISVNFSQPLCILAICFLYFEVMLQGAYHLKLCLPRWLKFWLICSCSTYHYYASHVYYVFIICLAIIYNISSNNFK